MNESEILDRIWRKVISYRFGQVCKHLVVCDILTLMEEAGYVIPKELAYAVVNTDDEKALSFPKLEREINQNPLDRRV